MASMDYCIMENTYGDLLRCIKKMKKGERLSELENCFRQALYDAAKLYIEACDEYKPKDED